MVYFDKYNFFILVAFDLLSSATEVVPNHRLYFLDKMYIDLILHSYSCRKD